MQRQGNREPLRFGQYAADCIVNTPRLQVSTGLEEQSESEAV